MRRQVPSERRATCAWVAETSKTRVVLVACRTRTVRRQYERAIVALGGNLDNVVFRMLPPPISDERTSS